MSEYTESSGSAPSREPDAWLVEWIEDGAIGGLRREDPTPDLIEGQRAVPLYRHAPGPSSQAEWWTSHEDIAEYRKGLRPWVRVWGHRSNVPVYFGSPPSETSERLLREAQREIQATVDALSILDRSEAMQVVPLVQKDIRNIRNRLNRWLARKEAPHG